MNHNKYDPEEQQLNQQLDAIARRMVDGETREEDIMLTMKYSEVLQYKVRDLREWDHWRATVDAKK